MKKRHMRTLVKALVVSLACAACTMGPKSSSVRITLKLPKKQAAALAKGRPGPSNIQAMDCLVLNVSAADIAPPPPPAGMGKSELQCMGLGVVSELIVLNASGEAEVALSVPAGAKRKIQVLGVWTPAGNACSGKLKWTELFDGTKPAMYSLGSTVTDLFDNQAVNLQSDYDSATATDMVSSCGGGPSGPPPAVVNLTSSFSNASYGTGQTIPITVTFDSPVFVTGTPKLTLETGAADAEASYVSGNGTTDLVFNYVVSPGESSGDLDASTGSALVLNGGAIQDSHGANAVLTVPILGAAGSLFSNKNIVIDAIAPIVTAVTTTHGDGTYGTGTAVPIKVEFSKNIVYSGNPQLTLETGTSDAVLTVVSAVTNTLLFTYTVAPGHSSSDLDYKAVNSLALNGGTINDTLGNNAVLTLPAPGGTNSLADGRAILINAISPTVVSVTSSAGAGPFAIGAAIPIFVNFDKVVTVTGGPPTLTLETGTVDAVVAASAGAPSTIVTFNYTVAAGHTSPALQYVATNSLALAGATIRDALNNDANLTLPILASPQSLAGGTTIAVDGVRPKVSNVTSSTADSTYGVGQNMTLSLTFTKAVSLTGTLKLTLETGTTDQIVTCPTITGGNTLECSYTVISGDTTSDLSYVDENSLDLNGATLNDAVGNPADLALPTPGDAGSLKANKAIVIDAVPPTVLSVSSTKGNGTYGTGTTMTIDVTFSKIVIVAGGTPSLTLETGIADAILGLNSGSGTTTLHFNYTVAAGHSSGDLAENAVSPLALNGATIKDDYGNAAVLTIPGGNSLGDNKNIVIDAVAPTITNVTSTAGNGSYGVGSTIDITVTFDDSVTASNTTPTLELETGSPDTPAVYFSGNGSNIWTFRYTVATNDQTADLNYINTSSLNPNTATIKDALENPAILTLPPVAGANSLGTNKDIVIDAVRPVITNVSAGVSDGTYVTGQTIPIQLTFDKGVNISGGTPRVQLETGTTDRYATYTGGSGTTHNFEYTVQEGDSTPDLNYLSTSAFTLGGGTVLDALNNPANLTLPALAGPNSLGTQHDIVIDEGPTYITSVTTTEPMGILSTGASMTIRVNFNRPVSSTGTIKLVLETGVVDTAATASPQGPNPYLNFSYSVVAGDNTGHLDFVAGSLDLNGGTIQDADLLTPELALPAPGSPNSLAGSSQIAVQTLTAAYTETGGQAGEKYGGAVAFVGDLDKDGKDDFLVAAPEYDVPPNDAGRVKVLSGAPGHTALFPPIDGGATGHLGHSVAKLGDVNGDGNADFAIGEPFSNTGGPNRGCVRIYSYDGSLLHTIFGVTDGERLGHSVAGIGDVDGDGIKDFIVGAPFAPAGGTDRGRTQVYLGGSWAPSWTTTGGADNEYDGWSVAGVGDLDQDGLAEFMVGSYGSSAGQPGAGRAVVYKGSDGTQLIVVNGTETGAGLGYSVAGAGDTNGDGVPDLLLGEWKGDAGGTDRGAAYLFSGATGSPLLWTFKGVDDNGKFGHSVSGAGDVDGDGKADVIVGAPDTSNGGSPTRGVAYVFSGVNGRSIYALKGAGSGNGFGFSVSGGSDVNGDGRSDLLIGEPGNDGGGTDAGGFTLFFSSFAVLPTGAPSPLYTLTGTSDGDQLGSSVAAAGDVNGDGKADFIIGEPGYGVGGANSGRVTVVSGGTGATIHTKTGNAGSFFGAAVAGGGDFDRDGRADFIVGAPQDTGISANTGVVYVYSGRTGGLITTHNGTQGGGRFGAAVANAGRFGVDAYDDIVVGAPFEAGGGSMRGTVYVFSGNGGGQLAAIVGDVDNAQFGYSVAGIGDGDGDGRDDIIAGAPFGRATATGYAAVYQGPSGALGPSVAGSAPGARMGFQVSGIGDADDDGHPDFMASEPYATTTQTEGGRVRVYRWPDTATIATVVGTAPNQHLGTALGAGGDVNGDGKPDLIVGEPEHDSARGRFRVFSGFDGSSLHTLTGQEASAALGSSVAIVGDVNRDGKADFAAGEPNASGSGAIPIRSAKGRAYIFVAPTN